MSVEVLIITHADIGKALVSAAKTVLGELPLTTHTLAIAPDCCPQDTIAKFTKSFQNKISPEGLLVLTDLFGATPSNIGEALAKIAPSRFITGLNLPMLLRIMNYPNSSLTELAEKAVSGGKEGIFDTENNE